MCQRSGSIFRPFHNVEFFFIVWQLTLKLAGSFELCKQVGSSIRLQPKPFLTDAFFKLFRCLRLTNKQLIPPFLQGATALRNSRPTPWFQQNPFCCCWHSSCMVWTSSSPVLGRQFGSLLLQLGLWGIPLVQTKALYFMLNKQIVSPSGPFLWKNFAFEIFWVSVSWLASLSSHGRPVNYLTTIKNRVRGRKSTCLPQHTNLIVISVN